MSVDVLSDSHGADLAPFLRGLIPKLREKWLLKLSAEQPQPKPQETVISLTLAPNGQVLAMHLDSSTAREAAGQAAWNVLKDAAYAPLPSQLEATDLKLRMHFTIN